MRTSLLLALFLMPFFSYSQYSSCEEAEENITCGLDIELLGATENFVTNVLSFIATDNEAYVEIYWECIEEPESFDVYSVLWADCLVTSIESSPGCEFGPVGESVYIYEGLTIGETYFISFESCGGIPCDFEGFLQMEFSETEIFELDFATPAFADGCSDPDLMNGEFCIDKEILISTTTDETYPQQLWTINAISGSGDVDGVIWVDQNGNTGEGSEFEIFDSSVDV